VEEHQFECFVVEEHQFECFVLEIQIETSVKLAKEIKLMFLFGFPIHHIQTDVPPIHHIQTDVPSLTLLL